MNINIQTIGRFHHQRSLHRILIKVEFSKDFRGHLAIARIYFAQLCMIVWKFVRVKIARYPEHTVVGTYTKLRHFFGYNEMVELFLLWELIAEPDPVVKDPENDIHQDP